MPHDTIPARFFRTAAERGDAPAYAVKRGGDWEATPWTTFGDEVRQAARALIALGLEPEDTTAIIGFNRPEWTIFDLATMTAGGVPVGVYTSCSPRQVEYILNHAEARVFLVEDEDQWYKIADQLDALPHLDHVVLMQGATVEHPKVWTWDAFMAQGETVEDEAVQARIDTLQPEQLATLIYTSGTTGPPKGVMITHRNLTAAIDMGAELLPTGSDAAEARLLSYLPLAHIAEKDFTIMGPATYGYCIYYAESVERLPDNLKEVQPDVFFGVPRVWEKFHAGLSGRISEATGVKRALLDWAMGVGRRINALRSVGTPPSGWLRLQYRLANTLIFRKIKEAIGLSRAQTCVSAAAPLSADVIAFMASLDVFIQEVYGQSEDTGPTTLNRRGQAHFGSVGTPFRGVEVRIADDGEILVRGENVFAGYYKDPENTARTLVDGWLHSGDIGHFDDLGFLHITGRKKEIIITAGGKNIAPRAIEEAIQEHPLVGEVVVVGDRRKFLSALITLDEEHAPTFAQEHGLSAAELPEHDDVQAVLQAHIDEVNTHLAKVETIKKFAVLPRPFSQEHGELTPTLKLKRSVIHDNWAAEIDAMYAETTTSAYGTAAV
jgi:long-chain acyl-CoA synthetase